MYIIYVQFQRIHCAKPTNITYLFFCVCVDVMYSGEYDVSDVTRYYSDLMLPPWSGKLFSLPGVDAHSE